MELKKIYLLFGITTLSLSSCTERRNIYFYKSYVNYSENLRFTVRKEERNGKYSNVNTTSINGVLIDKKDTFDDVINKKIIINESDYIWPNEKILLGNSYQFAYSFQSIRCDDYSSLFDAHRFGFAIRINDLNKEEEMNLLKKEFREIKLNFYFIGEKFNQIEYNKIIPVIQQVYFWNINKNLANDYYINYLDENNYTNDPWRAEIRIYNPNVSIDYDGEENCNILRKIPFIKGIGHWKTDFEEKYYSEKVKGDSLT